MLSVALLGNQNASKFPADYRTVHVKVSDTETWDYPAEWGVKRIKEDLEKRLAAEVERKRKWAAQVPASRRAECGAIPPASLFSNQLDDCVRLFLSNYGRGVYSGWESQIETAPGRKNGAASCEPWERDWGNDRLKPGSVVTNQGNLTHPNGRSNWEIIAAVTPWAIAPPLGVLALGASLFWAFAGFRRQSP